MQEHIAVVAAAHWLELVILLIELLRAVTSPFRNADVQHGRLWMQSGVAEVPPSM